MELQNKNNMNFNSQICTSKSQSEALLKLGLKKETADMYYSCDIICAKPYHKVVEFMNGCVPENIFPAWSLHRLIEMMPPCIKDGYLYSLVYDIHRDAIEYISFANGGLERQYNRLLWDTQSTNPYDNIICCIEWLIKEGCFDKEYLV